MILNRTKQWWKCAIARAERTVAQTWLGTMPATLVITPTMIKEADFSLLLVVVAWLLTGFCGGFASVLTSYVKGIPELEGATHDDELR